MQKKFPEREFTEEGPLYFFTPKKKRTWAIEKAMKNSAIQWSIKSTSFFFGGELKVSKFQKGDTGR